MHASDIEAVPALTLRSLAVAREIGFAVVDIGDVTLTYKGASGGELSRVGAGSLL